MFKKEELVDKNKELEELIKDLTDKKEKAEKSYNHALDSLTALEEKQKVENKDNKIKIEERDGKIRELNKSIKSLEDELNSLKDVKAIINNINSALGSLLSYFEKKYLSQEECNQNLIRENEMLRQENSIIKFLEGKLETYERILGANYNISKNNIDDNKCV